jgi:hypothetical protein
VQTQQTELDDRTHPGVVCDLLDLQARLRGEPATLVWPRAGRPGAGDAEDGRSPGHSDASGSKIETLRRRLAALELEIESYESAVEQLRVISRREAVVLPFHRPDAPPDED